MERYESAPERYLPASYMQRIRYSHRVRYRAIRSLFSVLVIAVMALLAARVIT